MTVHTILYLYTINRRTIPAYRITLKRVTIYRNSYSACSYARPIDARLRLDR